MNASEILQEMARQVRRDTIRILEAAEGTWLTHAPPGTSNHIIWHAGHALWLQDLLCERLLGAGGHLPSGWHDKFGMNCKPPSQTTEWPHRDTLTDLLQIQLVRILDLLASASENKLSTIADPRRGSATISDRIIHGLHDEAKHSGEMYLIMKLCRTHDKSKQR